MLCLGVAVGFVRAFKIFVPPYSSLTYHFAFHVPLFFVFFCSFGARLTVAKLT